MVRRVENADLGAMTTRALAAALRSPTGGRDALGEVIRRKPNNLRAILERTVASSVFPKDVRKIASTTLGDIRDDRSIAALLVASKSADNELSRRAIEALGKTGTAETLVRLSRLRKSDLRVRKSLAFARRLIAYRHGVKGWSLRLPHDAVVMHVDSDQAVVLKGSRMSRRAWVEVAPSLGVIKEVLPRADSMPIAFSCGKNEFILLVNPLLEAEASAVAMTRPLVAAVLMKFSLAQQHWFVAEYFLSDPVGAGQARITGARPTGTIVHSGVAVAERGDLQVRVQSLDTPLAVPTAVTASVGPTVPLGVQFAALVERARLRNLKKPRVPVRVSERRAHSALR